MNRYTIMGEVVQPAFNQWRDAVSTYFSGFSVTYTSGYWQGKVESSFKLEILVPDASGPDVVSILKNLCERYRHAANQSEVWMTEDTVRVHKAVKPEPATV